MARAHRAPPGALPAAPTRGGALALWAALLAGGWLVRVSPALPAPLAAGADMLLVLGTAVLVMLAVRRALRRRVARGRAARVAGTTSSRPPPAAE